MRFAYYETLSADSKRTYRKSDALLRVDVPDLASLTPLARAIEPALAAEDRKAVERACQALVDAINARLETPPVRMNVLEHRPSNSGGELHGLYEPDEVTGGVAKISVWMRTAQKEQVVKFRTFLHRGPRALPSLRLRALWLRGDLPHPGLLHPRIDLDARAAGREA